MTYNHQIQNIHKAKCMYIHVRVYLLHAYMHGHRDVLPGWWAVRVKLVKKSPDNFFSPQLILQWGPNVYFKETIIFLESKQVGQNVRGSNLFQGDGAQLLFSIDFIVIQGVPDSLYPPPPLVSRIAYVHVSMFVAF